MHNVTQKWLDHLLLMTSYLVTIATDSHQTCVKMCLRDMPTATENGMLLTKNHLEKIEEKPYRGGIHRPSCTPEG